MKSSIFITRIRIGILALGVLFMPITLYSQIKVHGKVQEPGSYFPIVNATSTVTIYHDSADLELVHHVSRHLAEDIERVTGRRPVVSSSNGVVQGSPIIIGTIGRSHLIDRLAAEGRISIDPIRGNWERFIIQTVRNPLPGVEQALVIAGSDRRGTAFGVFTLSEAIGVTPWYWWADVPVTRSSELHVEPAKYVSRAPSVKYRGIFLNDEGWGLNPWASKTFDPEMGNIGPRTYQKVFELVLRLKGNMVAPAMHPGTRAFFTVPGNMEMADSYGIIITTAHCEPLLFNNATEWDIETQGEWNYMTNRDEIRRVLNDRVKQAAANENIYTIALRGMHDEGMIGPGDDTTRLKMLEKATRDQREILTKHIAKPIEDIPQIFVPYKEVLEIYEMGMELPEDIIIVWPDDNYGFIKRFSNEKEMKRSGGTGVYYHISYLGWPNDYLWLNTTPPSLMFAELDRAYSLGSDRYWLLNVGDIKPGEMGTQIFMDMAWDFSRFSFDNIHRYEAELLASKFGKEFEDDLAYILDRYYYHGFTRKPEYMTWDYRWNSLFSLDTIQDTDLSFINYREAETRLAEYNRIVAKARTILNQLPEEKKAAFFQLIYYPVRGASLYNHQMLIAQKNRWYARQGRAMTNSMANKVKMYHDSLAWFTQEYNALLDGRWNHMMTAPGFLPEIQLPPTQIINLPRDARMALFVEGQSDDSPKSYNLPEFSRFFGGNHFFEVYNQGQRPLRWRATPSADWIIMDVTQGNTPMQQRVHVSIDWDKVPSGDSVKGYITVSHGRTSKTIGVPVFNPSQPQAEELHNLFVERDGAVSICPAGYHRKHEDGDIRFQVINNLGYSNLSLQLGHGKHSWGDGSYVEYDIYLFTPGWATIYSYMLPLFARDRSHSTRYGIQINDQEVVTHSNDVVEWTQPWADNVIRNSAIDTTRVYFDRPGRHKLRIYSKDPGMIIQRLIIDTGGLRDSYLGPNPTRVVGKQH